MGYPDLTRKLQDLMGKAGIVSFKSLSRLSGVSPQQILRLRSGKIDQMRLLVLLKLATVLNLSLTDLIANFAVSSDALANCISESPNRKELLQKVTDLQMECDRLSKQLENQPEILEQDFQESSLQILESLLVFWPTAAQSAKEDPQKAAINIVPLVQKPLEKLLQAWGVEAIAAVGAEIPYDPQWHQALEGNPLLGERVKVRYIGYRKGNKLLYRARVVTL